jgi:transposase
VLPDPAPTCAKLVLTQIGELQWSIKTIERSLVALRRVNGISLATVPGVGVITAKSMVATVVDASAFKCGVILKLGSF